MKKVYVLERESQQDDVFYLNIEGIYSDKDEAETVCEGLQLAASWNESYYVLEWDVQ